jgi:hypothetical protein
VGVIDYRFIEIGPAGNISAEGMCQVNKYFFTHDQNLSTVVLIFYLY